MTGPPKISQADWDKHKAYLYDSYITRDKTLSQVIQQAENEQGFRPSDASKAQYIRQFKKWKLEKNLRGDQWKKIAKVVRNRKTYGKDSEILIKDGRVSDRRLRKEMSRYRRDDCSDLSLDDMDGIIIGTPQGEAVQAINYLQIPWFRFQTLIEPYFDEMRRRDSGLALSNPSVSLASDTMQIEPPTEALRLLAGCTSTSNDAYDVFEALNCDLEDITIEKRDHERADNLVQRRGPFKLEQMSLFIRYFVYLSSNNLLDNERIDKLVKWMVESKTQWVLDLLLDLRTPTTEIFGCTIFVSAAKLGEIDLVRSLIARGIDVDASAGPVMRRTALEQAVFFQHPRIVKLLLSAGADPKTQFNSESWLLDATLKGPHILEILEMLFNEGADVNAVHDWETNDRGLLLTNAVEDGDHKIIRFLLDAGANIDAFDGSFGTALHRAVFNDDVESVQILIDAGADMEATAKDLAYENEYYNFLLRTPIQQASLEGNAEIVQVLVNEGADVNAFGWDGYDDLDAWEEYRRHQWKATIRLRTPTGAHVDLKGFGDTPFQMAAALDEAKIMQILRTHGADVNAPATDEGGKTALQAAVRAGNYELVRNLLVSGSDINAAASLSEGRTALQAAAESGNGDLAKFLIEAGADVNADASPESGRTSLQAAVEHGHVEMVSMLLNEGADVNGSAATISGGLTALQAAFQAGTKIFDDGDEESDIKDNDEEPDVWTIEQSRNTILQALFDAGADISAPSSPQGGMTPIVGAVKTGRPDLVRWCLLRGADPNIPAGGTTALGAAAMWGSADLVNLLIEAGADVNAYCEMKYRVHKGTLWTALHVAARTGTIEIANLLLEAGAEINMPLPSSSSQTALQFAIADSSITMVQFLLNKGADPCVWPAELPMNSKRILHTFVHMEILNALAVAGADFNRIVEVYVLSFTREVMRKLLDSGLLIHWTAEQKSHLLQVSIKCGYTDLIQEMLDAGADVNTPAAHYFGRTALQQATVKGYTDVVTLLLSCGADVNAPAGHQGGITALQGAVMNGNLKIVLTLLQAGAEINAPPAVESGRTALQAAAEHGRLDIVSLLLENDHDTKGMELRCEGAAVLAEREGHKVIARILREHKAGQGSTE
ncbi:hypothetical protein JMJ35_009465 [Cladonia borealis]|uniref:Clr5 domain-containing protein n=1 Tax=Cladonia borealis TaxID=184061 RepID=A0AA39QU08_9LECA|nr:hypothetical protein JMJ35_009465 [Cladonia borealis]